MLRIALKDGEKIVVNGAVLRSIGRTEILVESRAALLRGREVMAPGEANTAARQLYFYTMMAYIDPENLESHQAAVIEALQAVTATLGSAEAGQATMSFARHAAGMQYYRALADCRALMALERAQDEKDAPSAAVETVEAVAVAA